MYNFSQEFLGAHVQVTGYDVKRLHILIGNFYGELSKLMGFLFNHLETFFP